MLSSVLGSTRAIAINIEVMGTFVKVRGLGDRNLPRERAQAPPKLSGAFSFESKSRTRSDRRSRTTFWRLDV